MLAVLTDPEDVFVNPHYIGAAELAARLGSIVNFDRLGQVLIAEGFEAGLGKWLAAVSPSCSASISAKTARNGAFSAKLAVDNTAGHSAVIKRVIPYPPSATRLGAEISFASTYGKADLWLEMVVCTGSLRYTTKVKYDPVASKLYYFDNTFNWHEVAPYVIQKAEIHSWSTLKYVIDLAAAKYVRLKLNSMEYDISTAALYSDASATAPGVEIDITCDRNNGAESLYVDDFVLTQSEP